LIGYALGPWLAVLWSSQWRMPNVVAVPIEVEAWDHSSQAKLFALLKAEVAVLQVWGVPHSQPILFLSPLPCLWKITKLPFYLPISFVPCRSRMLTLHLD